MDSLARDGLSDEQVRTLLTGEGVRPGHGMELLDANNLVVADLSDDCQPWTVTYDNSALVHGSLSVSLTTELDWATARLRPYMTLHRDDIGTARFNAGVYVLAVPTEQHGTSLRTWDVTGRNLLALLDKHPGDTYVVTAGTTYLDALRTLVTDAGLTVPLGLDGSRQGTTLPETRVWWNVTYLQMASDLLAEIAYTDLFSTMSGAYRARPLPPQGETPPTGWVFDSRPTSEARNADLVAADWTEERVLSGGFNRWRFVQQNLAYQPIIGDGIFEWTNTDIGPLSTTALGEVRPAPIAALDVADQAALEAEGWRIIAADMRAEHSAAISVDPLPIAGHRDTVRLRTSARDLTMQVSSWTLTPYERAGWLLGGGDGGEAPERPETQAVGTVTSASPLRVVLDGATTDSPAVVLESDTTSPSFVIGARVRVAVRSPLLPTVQGTVS